MKARYGTAYALEGILNDLDHITRSEPSQQVKQHLRAVTDKLSALWDSLEVDPNE